MPYTIQQIIGIKVPDILGIDRSQINATDGKFTYSKMVDNLNAANLDIARDSALQESPFLKQFYRFPVAANSNNNFEVIVPLPKNMCIAIALDGCVDGSSTTQYRPVARVWGSDSAYAYNGMNAWVTTGYGASSTYYPTETDLILQYPFFQKYQFIYQRTPGALFYGNVADPGMDPPDDQVSISDTGIVGMPSAFDDAYVLDQIAVIEPDTGKMQIRRVTAYDYATLTFTVDVPWTTIPDETYTFSVLSFLPESAQDLLVLGLGVRFGTDLPPERMGTVQVDYGKQLDAFKNTIWKTDRATPNTVEQRMLGMAFNQPNSVSGWGAWTGGEGGF